VLKYSQNALIAAGVAIALLGFRSTPAAAEEPAAPAKAAPAAGEKAGDSPAAATPAADAKPTVAADKEKAAGDCRKAVEALGKGDPSALDALDKNQRDLLVGQPAAADALTCLAIAENNEKFCAALPPEGKDACVSHRKVMGDLKGVPKEGLKAQIIHKMCVNDMPAGDCEIVRQAIAAGDAGKCTGLTKIDANFCTAIASADASKCKALSDKTMEAVCAAYALDDPKHCPDDSQDCRNLTTFMATVSKKGLSGVADLNSGAAAAVEGRSSCAAALSALEKVCDGPAEK